VTLIHLFGLRLVAWINNAGVYTELAGVVLIIVAPLSGARLVREELTGAGWSSPVAP
jgi:amino acid transporter